MIQLLIRNKIQSQNSLEEYYPDPKKIDSPMSSSLLNSQMEYCVLFGAPHFKEHLQARMIAGRDIRLVSLEPKCQVLNG